MTPADVDTLRAMLRDMLAESDRTAEAIRRVRPDVTDSHSDGRRVRYVRAETASQTLRDVLALMAD